MPVQREITPAHFLSLVARADALRASLDGWDGDYRTAAETAAFQRGVEFGLSLLALTVATPVDALNPSQESPRG